MGITFFQEKDAEIYPWQAADEKREYFCFVQMRSELDGEKTGNCQTAENGKGCCRSDVQQQGEQGHGNQGRPKAGKTLEESGGKKNDRYGEKKQHANYPKRLMRMSPERDGSISENYP